MGTFFGNLIRMFMDFLNSAFSNFFRSNHFKFAAVQNGWVSPAQAKCPNNNLYAMGNFESKPSTGYYSEVWIDKN